MTEAKADIRRRLLARRRGLPQADVSRASKALCPRLASLPEVVAAPVLAFYVAFAGEIDLKEFFLTSKRQGKEILLPRYCVAAGCYEMVTVQDIETDTRPAHYGIREPLPELAALPDRERNRPQVVWLVPGVAFAPQGERLGHGGGYYDRLLSSAQGLKIGICHDWQILPELPCTERDVRMDMVISDRRLLPCRRASRPPQDSPATAVSVT